MTVKNMQIEDEHQLAEETATDSTALNGLPPKSKYVYQFSLTDNDILSILFSHIIAVDNLHIFLQTGSH